jgi:hypothetical protein
MFVVASDASRSEAISELWKVASPGFARLATYAYPLTPSSRCCMSWSWRKVSLSPL